jgi:hypothetical protein
MVLCIVQIVKQKDRNQKLRLNQIKITNGYSQYIIMHLCCTVQYKNFTLFEWWESVGTRIVHAVEYRVQNAEKAVDINRRKIYLIQKSQLNIQYSVY